MSFDNENPFQAPLADDLNAQNQQTAAPAEGALVRAKLMPPAVIMIVIAIISAFFMVVDFGFRIYNLSNPQWIAIDEQQRMSMIIGNYIGAGIDLANFLCQFLVISGCVAMMKGRHRQRAVTASVISMIPCISGCCILNIPFGIWAYMVLNQPEVMSYFAMQKSQSDY